MKDRSVSDKTNNEKSVNVTLKFDENVIVKIVIDNIVIDMNVC